MAYIPYTSDENAGDELRSSYDTVRGVRGNVANILRVQSLNPPSLKAHFELYRAVVLGRSNLSRVRREMIGVVVSSLNSCHY